MGEIVIFYKPYQNIGGNWINLMGKIMVMVDIFVMKNKGDNIICNWNIIMRGMS